MVSLTEGAAAVTPSSGTEEKLARQFKLLGDATRLRILGYLRGDAELHVSALQQRLGQSQPAVSHHLGLLREAGLVTVRREGKHNFYSLSEPNIDLLAEQLMHTLGRTEVLETPEVAPATSVAFNPRSDRREPLLTTAP